MLPPFNLNDALLLQRVTKYSTLSSKSQTGVIEKAQIKQQQGLFGRQATGAFPNV
jgi:hypothetical protein